MNNKQLGTEFEQEMCRLLKDQGMWVHFMTPDATGSQPFDIIAVKNTCAVAIDCKTSAKPIFSLDRLEWNQKLAFALWRKAGNGEGLIAVKYDAQIYFIEFGELETAKKIDLREIEPWGGEL